MKNLVYFFFVASLLLGSCTDENVVNVETLALENFTDAGIIHNSFLDNAKNNFEIVKSLSSTAEKVEYINSFNLNYVEKLELDENSKAELKAGLLKNKELVQVDELTGKAYHLNRNGRVNTDERNIFQSIEILYEDDLISKFAYDFLNDFSKDVKSNYEGTLSDEELKSKTLQYISEFENHGYSVNSGEGEMIGTILSVSIASIEWWEENQEVFTVNTENGRVVIAPWAAADLVGAAWGGATGAIGSYAGGGEVSWTAVGVGALSGAIAGSTGAVGKIAKWLF